jgi:hypothetical protein
MYNCTFLAGKFLEKPKLYLWIKVLIHKCCKWQKLGINTYCALNYLFCMLIVVIWTDWKPHLYMYLFQLNLQIKSLLNYTNQIASNKYHKYTFGMKAGNLLVPVCHILSGNSYVKTVLFAKFLKLGFVGESNYYW